MKKKKLFKIVSISLLGVFILFTILVVHIYLVSKPKEVPYDARQLSRIDFINKVDSTEAYKIKSFVSHLTGVESTHFNVQDGILVYTYSLEKQNSANVYDLVMKQGNYSAKKYEVNASQLATGCPAMGGKTSLINGLAMSVVKIFK